MDKSKIDHASVLEMLDTLFGEDLHAKRVLSLANATFGAIHAASLGVHAIGHALAQARGLADKHAIKQVDRLLGNKGIDVWSLFADWVPFVLADRTEVVVALDWTDYAADDQCTISLSIVTAHGRATPLLWKTVVKSELLGQRNAHEDALLSRLRELIPPTVRVTVLADRAFGDQKLYEFLRELGFDFVILFVGTVLVADDESRTVKPAAEWLREDGRARVLRNAAVTELAVRVPTVVFVKDRKMKEAWNLASSLGDATASDVIALYGRRFTIEESFRDIKDWRFGMGLSSVRVGACDRRDRVLLLSAMAIALLTLLGAAGESLGMERMLKANTSKTRTYSLFRQGTLYYGHIPNMKPERLVPLMEKFAELIREQRFFRNVFGLL